MEKKSLKTAPPVLSASLREIEDGLAYLQDARREDMLVEQCRIRGLMAENEDFYKLNLEGVVFENCTFFHCNFEKASFIDVQFRNCDFSNSVLDDCYFNRCEFLFVKGVGADFHESLLKETRWEECSLSLPISADPDGNLPAWPDVICRKAILRTAVLKRWSGRI